MLFAFLLTFGGSQFLLAAVPSFKKDNSFRRATYKSRAAVSYPYYMSFYKNSSEVSFNLSSDQKANWDALVAEIESVVKETETLYATEMEKTKTERDALTPKKMELSRERRDAVAKFTTTRKAQLESQKILLRTKMDGIRSKLDDLMQQILDKPAEETALIEKIIDVKVNEQAPATEELREYMKKLMAVSKEFDKTPEHKEFLRKETKLDVQQRRLDAPMKKLLDPMEQQYFDAVQKLHDLYKGVQSK